MTLAAYHPRAQPGGRVLDGPWARLAPVDWPRDAAALVDAGGAGPGAHDQWRHIPIGPFDTAEALADGMRARAEAQSWVTLTIAPQTPPLTFGAIPGEATSAAPDSSDQAEAALSPASPAPLGMASFMRIRPPHGSVEIGCVVYGPGLKRTPAATQAIALMAGHVFDELGYRRLEWKCDAQNAASMRAAVRLGFTFEGVFRNDMIVRGRNRDTAWFSITDAEWPRVSAGLAAWLHPDNFDAGGAQIRTLEAVRAEVASD